MEAGLAMSQVASTTTYPAPLRSGQVASRPMWLGRFKIRDVDTCGGCGEDASHAATWIFRGEIIVLGLCDRCSTIAQAYGESRSSESFKMLSGSALRTPVR